MIEIEGDRTHPSFEVLLCDVFEAGRNARDSSDPQAHVITSLWMRFVLSRPSRVCFTKEFVVSLTPPLSQG